MGKVIELKKKEEEQPLTLEKRIERLRQYSEEEIALRYYEGRIDQLRKVIRDLENGIVNPIEEIDR